MDISLTVLELVCISIGAGGALIFDFFFLLSLRDHKVRQYEIKSLKRLNLYSLVCISLSLVTYMTMVALYVERSTDLEIGFSLSKILIMAVAFLSALTLRKIHLPTLERYQNNYLHLSQNMVVHQDSLVATAAFSSVSWLSIILLTTLENRQVDIPFFENGLTIILTFIAVSYVASKVAVYLKKKIISA
jgi:hypothetical protein